MQKFFETHRRIIVTLLLLWIFGVGILTMTNDSAIVDEIAHIPSGYSYVAYGDYRLNPEHPPLLKDLAGLPLLLIQPLFPLDNQTWTKDVNGQWEAGWNFIYHYGNNADLIIFLARLPILLLAVLFGFVIYHFTAKTFGTLTGLLALFFYAFSPNIIAHSHFVTTDLGIAFFTFLALSTFIAFIKDPSKKTLAWTTIALAGAQAAKFSAVLLYPFYFAALLAVLLYSKSTIKLQFGFLKNFRKKFSYKAVTLLTSYIIMVVGSILMVWIFYIPHTINLPADKQVELIKFSLPAEQAEIPRNLLSAMSHNKILQPLAQYLLGVSMVFSRVSGGNTTYFLGEVTNQSFKWYFPVSYLLKTPLAFLILLLLCLAISLKRFVLLNYKKYWPEIKKFISNYKTEMVFLAFIVYYAGISITGNLNLGIRHLFPILPLIDILVAVRVVKFFTGFKGQYSPAIAGSVLGLLLFWTGFSTLVNYPHYLSYFNELIGGGKNGYWYFTDSNVDWGQDLKRFRDWVDVHPEIQNIKLDYFGGGEPKYYFCKRKLDENGNIIKRPDGYDCSNSRYQEWHIQYGKTKGWIAVSATFLQNAKWYAEKFGQQDYDWLRNRKPYAEIGNSILVYWVRD